MPRCWSNAIAALFTGRISIVSTSTTPTSTLGFRRVRSPIPVRHRSRRRSLRPTPTTSSSWPNQMGRALISFPLPWRNTIAPSRSIASGAKINRRRQEWGTVRRRPPMRNYLLNTACTEVSLLMVSEQTGDVPLQPPLQLTNVLPSGGMAVSVTTVPSVNFAEQAPPQLSARSFPFGVAVTVPGLLRPTESVCCSRKVAPTETRPLMLPLQVVCVPVQAPVHPVKMVLPGLMVRLKGAPLVSKLAQALPQLIVPPLTEAPLAP